MPYKSDSGNTTALDKTQRLLKTANKDIALGEIASAKRTLDRVLKLQPNNVIARYNHANALRDLGQTDRAISAFKELIRIAPTHAEAYRNLSSLDPSALSGPLLAQLERLVTDPRVNDVARNHLLFAWGNIKEHHGCFGDAFNCFHRANAMRKIALGYHLNQDYSRFQQLRTLNSRILDIEAADAHRANHVPIFILGMPRTGSTLLEQMISQHAEVCARGELAKFTALTLKPALDGVHFDEGRLTSIRSDYFTFLNSLKPNAKYVIDKMPHNFLVLPLILRAIPEAKIIHVIRDPAATCWSNFRHFFSADEMAYSHDLADLAGYYQLYRTLVCEFVASTFESERVCHVNYERLVKDTETSMRNVFSFLGLAWDPACLRPDQNARIARTASQLQVKKRVYLGSSTFWQNYKAQIGDRFDELVNSQPEFLNQLRQFGSSQSVL